MRSPGDEARREQRIAELVGEPVELPEGDDPLPLDQTRRVAVMKGGAAYQAADLHERPRFQRAALRSFSTSARLSDEPLPFNRREFACSTL